MKSDNFTVEAYIVSFLKIRIIFLLQNNFDTFDVLNVVQSAAIRLNRRKIKYLTNGSFQRLLATTRWYNNNKINNKQSKVLLMIFLDVYQKSMGNYSFVNIKLQIRVIVKLVPCQIKLP